MPDVDPALRPVDHRVKHVCDVCGGFDDHPRHSMYAPGAEQAVPDPALVVRVAKTLPDDADGAQAMKDLMDTATIVRHMDCCRDVGCPDGSCGSVLDAAGGKTGDPLVKHLTAQVRKLSEKGA